MPPLRYGLKLSPQLTTVDEMRAVWRIADESGFDHVWNFDHFAAIAGDPAGDVLEGWTLLGAMAEATSRVRIGCMVTGNTYRHPGILAKMAVTVDHLSNGRLEMGIGAGWAEIEHTTLGLEFGASPGRRIAWLDEACRVMKLLWTEERATFEGEHYRLEGAYGNPKPVQRPWPPLWIGGSGERKTLRVVAEHADVWNAGAEPDEVARLSGVLDRHCADVGRDPSEIRRSVQFRYDGDDDEALRLAEGYVARGITELVLMLPAGRGEARGESAARLLPRLRELG